MTGTNSKVYQGIREQLIRLLAHCEAYIDFGADELSDPRLSASFHEVTLEVE